MRAVTLYERACQLGAGRGCTLLGERFAAGDGVTMNPKLAQMWNSRGCELGDGRGCGNVGSGYQLGFGGRSDPERAARYYKRACDAGEAQFCQLLERFAKSAGR